MPMISTTELLRFIDGSLVSFYNTYLYPINDMSLSDYIMAQDFPYEEWYSDISEHRRNYKKSRVKARLYWYQCAIRDLQLRKEGSNVEKYFSFLAAGDASLTWEQYAVEMKVLLDEWRNNTDSLLTDFPVIKASNTRIKEQAFLKEVILNIIELLEKKVGVYQDKNKSNNDVLLQPLEFILGPFVSVNSPGVELDITKDDNNRTILYNDYKVPYTGNYGNYIIRSYIENSDIIKYESNIRTLSTFDISVFLYIINYVCENDYATFLSTRTFQNSLSDIVKAVFPNESRPSTWNYSRVKNSLLKLSSLQVKGIRDNEIVRTINFFSDYRLDEENGQQIVTLVVGSYVYDRIATKKAQLISKEVAAITDRSAQYVYYVFENERQKAYALNSINKEQNYEYIFFLHTMRFPSRYSVKKNMDFIEEIFKTFIENDILIQYYIRKPKKFILKFKPFSKEDIAKLKLGEPTLLT